MSVFLSWVGSAEYRGKGRVYFWANAKSLTGNPAPTWVSVDLVAPIVRRCLVISDDGNHVAVVGYLYGVAVEGVLAYWNNARTLTGHPQPPTWSGQEPDDILVDVAISDDGNFVAVAGGAIRSTVFYWAGATTRTGTLEPHTWASEPDVSFTSIDMSCDGGSVIPGAEEAAPEQGGGHSVYFWGGARSLTGNPAPSWIFPTDFSVEDVAINDAGTYMAAVDLSSPDTVYFFDKQGNLLWQDTTLSGDKLSISCDGGTLAVGEPVGDTAYLFDTGFSSPCCGVEAVGGVVMPVNTFAIVVPWLAAIGLVGCIGTVVMVARKRHP